MELRDPRDAPGKPEEAYTCAFREHFLDRNRDMEIKREGRKKGRMEGREGERKKIKERRGKAGVGRKETLLFFALLPSTKVCACTSKLFEDAS